MYYYIKDDYNKQIAKLRQNIADTNKKVEELEQKINNYLHRLEEDGSNEKQEYDWFIDICPDDKNQSCHLEEYRSSQKTKINTNSWFNLGIFYK
jgi:chromosome segregation ATPase